MCNHQAVCSAVAARRTSAGAVAEAVTCDLFTDEEWRGLSRTCDLSKRQVQIAKLLCEDATYAAMAERLNISVNTVRMHMRALFGKLAVRDRVGVVLCLTMAQRRLGQA